MHKLEDWMEGLGLGKYARVLIDLEVDFEVLPELNESDLEKLDIPLGPRKKLLKAIAALSDQAQPSQAREPDSIAERRQLTVMFCDLVGSTAMSEQLDAEDLGDVIRAYQECCTAVIERFNGTIARYSGDGLLIYFGYPRAHEDDAERAIHTGLGLIAAVSSLKPHGLTLQTRIGIATGPVVVGEMVGEGTAREQTVVGETPNLAARLQALAAPDGVVIADQTFRLAGAMFECKDLGKQQLKGFSEPVKVWQAIGERSIESRYDAISESAGVTPIVGREEESEMLFRRWTVATEGKGQVAMLSGEAGIGKSRLIQSLRDRITDEPHMLLRYHCAPHHQDSALYPVIAHLERAAQFERDDDADARLDKLERLNQVSNGEFAEAASLFAVLLSIPTQGRYPDLEMSPAAQKEKILTMLEAQFDALAAQKPLLVIFEDLHWVDPSTLEVLERAIARIHGSRVLMLLTARPEFVAPWSDAPHSATISLNRLSSDRIRELIKKVAGGKSLPDLLVETISEKTDGVPLFVEELTKNVLEAGFLKDAGDHYVLQGPVPALAVPSTLQDSLMARLDRMSSVKEIAQTGAVIGREFFFELLAAVSPLTDSGLDSGLRQLQGASLIFRRGHPPESKYTFKHALVQDAAYDSLLRSKRQEVHRKIAIALEKQFPERAETEPEVLARHYTGARQNELAIVYWQRAAQRALGRSAYVESVNHCNKGLELLNEAPPSSERSELELELRSMLGVGSVATMGYAADAIADNYARSQEICEELGETPRLIPTLYGLWVYHLLRGHREQSVELADQLYRYSEDTHQPLVTASPMAVTAFYSGDRKTADKLLSDAVARYDPQKHEAIARTFGDDADLLPNFYHYWNLWLCGYPDQARTMMTGTNGLVADLGTPYVVATSMLFELILHHELKDTEAVVDTASRFKTHSSEQGFPFFVALSMTGSGWAMVENGDTEKGLQEIRQGIANFRLTGAQLPVSYWLHYLVEANLTLSNTADGLLAVDEALDLANSQLDDFYLPELYRLKGELHLQGTANPTSAERCFRKALELATAQNAKMFELRSTMSLSRLLRDRGEIEQAHQQLAETYSWFSEGLDTKDLIDAKDLLSELVV